LCTLSWPMLPVSLECPFLISPSVFSNVYLHGRIWGLNYSTLCDKVYQWLATSRWFSPGPPVSSTNKTDRHDITEILLKVALNTILYIIELVLVLNIADILLTKR
jgi:hypothetical protein